MSSPLPTPRRCLRVGMLSRLGAVEPWKASDLVTTLMIEQAYESPFSPSQGAETPEPLLFSEPLRTGGDVRTLYARVRPGVLFSDGSPCTAADVAASIAAVPDISRQAEVSARDDRVVFRLQQPDPNFMFVLAQAFFGVWKRADGALLGTGPFLPPEAQEGGDPTQSDHVVMRANSRSWKPPRLDAVAYDNYGTTEALFDAVKAGKVDATYGLTALQAAELGDAPVVSKTLEGSSTSFLYLNRERPALRDAFIRRALCLAVSRSEVARASYGALGVNFVADGILPPFLGARVRLGSPAADVRAAVRQLAEDNLTAPARLSLLLTWAPKSYLPDPQAAAEVIARNLRELGTAVEIVTPLDRADYRRRQASGDYDLLLGGWIADTPIAADFLDSLLGSRKIPTPASHTSTSSNLARWDDATTDRMISGIRNAPSLAGLEALYRRVEVHGLLVPLLHGRTVLVHGRNVRGLKASPLGRSSFREVDLAGSPV